MAVRSMMMAIIEIVVRHMIEPIGNDDPSTKNSLLMPIFMLVLPRNDMISGKIGCSLEYSLVEIPDSLPPFVGDLDSHIHIMISKKSKKYA